MADIIKIGTQDVTFKVGSSAVTAIFLGSNQVYPSGSQETYTQVEYIENSSNAYINLEVDPYDTLGNSFTIEATFSSYTQSSFGYLASTESVISPYYGFVFRWNSSVLEFDGASLTADTTATNVPNQDGTSAITISSTSTTTSNNNTPITLFCGLNGSSPWRNGIGRLYSFRMVLNNVTVRDMIPVVRDSDSKAGMYDRVNDVFYASPNGVLFTAGSPVPTPTYEWVSYETGDTVPATTVYGVKLYENYDEGYNVIFSGTTGDYIKFHPNGNFGQWAAEDENGTPIDISSYISYQAGRLMYTIEFSDLGLGGMNIISPSTTFEDDIDLYVTN